MPLALCERQLLAMFANYATLAVGKVLPNPRILMPTRNVNLTDELERFVLAKVGSGRYDNASEVVRAALRSLEREEQEYEAKLAGLRTAIDEGDVSGVADGDSFSRVRESLPLLKKQC